MSLVADPVPISLETTTPRAAVPNLVLTSPKTATP